MAIVLIWQVRVEQHKGQWNLKGPGGDLAFIEPAECRGGYAVVKFERADDNSVGKFLQMFERMAGERGIKLGRMQGRIIDGTNCRHGDQAEKLLDERVPKDVGLVVCVLSNQSTMNAREIYPAIKRWSHTKAMIPTQCVQVGKATGNLGSKPPYHAGALSPTRKNLSLSQSPPDLHMASRPIST